MPLYRITVAYDGTHFEGWQFQARPASPGKNAPRTVQGVVEGALLRLAAGAPVRVTGAGRTDAGVHAWGQVASFDLPREMDVAALGSALNGLLPADIRVLSAAAAPPGWNARRSATSKLYRYELDLGPVRLPTRRHYAGYHRGALIPERVLEVAALYRGRQDFAALASAGSTVTTSVRTVFRSAARFEPDPLTGDPQGRLIYEVTADGFLRKMVRSMVGGLLSAGSGARTADDLARALKAGNRGLWPPPAEACGLTLVWVAYSPPPPLAPLA